MVPRPGLGQTQGPLREQRTRTVITATTVVGVQSSNEGRRTGDHVDREAGDRARLVSLFQERLGRAFRDRIGLRCCSDLTVQRAITQQLSGRQGLHVGLDLRRAQSPIVDTNLINAALEILAPNAVAADAQRPRGNWYVARLRLFCDLNAVDKEPFGGAVISGGQMRPGVSGQRRHPRQILVVPADVDARDRLVGVGVGVEPISQTTGLFLEQHAAPAAHRSGRIHPCLQRHAIGQIQGILVRDRYIAITATKGQRLAELTPRGPTDVGQGAMITLAGGVLHGRTAAFLEVVGRDQATSVRIRLRYGDGLRRGAGRRAGDAGSGQLHGVGAGTGIRVRGVLGGAGIARRVWHAEIPGVTKAGSSGLIGERYRQGSGSGRGACAEFRGRRDCIGLDGLRVSVSAQDLARRILQSQADRIGTVGITSDEGLGAGDSGCGAIAKIPGSIRDIGTGRGIFQSDRKRRVPGNRAGGETGHRRCGRGHVHRDGLRGRGVSAPAQTGYDQIHVISARGRIALGRIRILEGAGGAIAEVPEPAGHGARRIVGQLQRLTGSDRRFADAELGDRVIDLIGVAAFPPRSAVISFDREIIGDAVRNGDRRGRAADHV